MFERDSKKGRRKAPSNLFKETDLYTLQLAGGGKEYAIEEALSKLEGRLSTLPKFVLRSSDKSVE
jgi:hypothetical protein